MTGKITGFHIQLQTESNIEDGIFITEVRDGYDINAHTRKKKKGLE